MGKLFLSLYLIICTGAICLYFGMCKNYVLKIELLELSMLVEK